MASLLRPESPEAKCAGSYCLAQENLRGGGLEGFPQGVPHPSSLRNFCS